MFAGIERNMTIFFGLSMRKLKSQLSYATEVWSPPTIKMRSKVGRVQRSATSWIMQAKRGEISYKQRLITLNLLPLCYDREINDLVLFLRCCMVISTLMCTGSSHLPTMAEHDSVEILLSPLKFHYVNQ